MSFGFEFGGSSDVPYVPAALMKQPKLPDGVAVAQLSEKDGEVFTLDFNAHRHHYCPEPTIELDPPTASPTKCPVPEFDMDGTYAMLGVLSPQECRQIIDLTERIGYKPTCIAGIAAQDHTLRGPDKVVWCADQRLVDAMFERCRHLLPPSVLDDRPLLGICPRFRCLRYKANQHQLGPHRDRGLYPMSQVDEDGELRYDILKDGSRSYMSFLIYLNEDFEGGETFFYAAPAPEEGDGVNEAKASAVNDTPKEDEKAHSKEEPSTTYSVGDIVDAIWSGDDDWYEATVLSVGAEELYTVRFNDDDQVRANGRVTCLKKNFTLSQCELGRGGHPS